jgi:hypothetical protein
VFARLRLITRSESQRLPATVLSDIGAARVGSSVPWVFDVGAGASGSFEAVSAPTDRVAAVPELAVRAERDLGDVQLGIGWRGGFPAWYGRQEVAFALDVDRLVHARICTPVAGDGDDIGGERCGDRRSLSLGFDLGAALYYYDAPPLQEGPTRGLMYAGPLARARVELHLSRVFLGAALAAVVASYDQGGSGIRLEPSLIVGYELGR